MKTGDDRVAQAELFGSVFLIAQHLTRRADRELADLDLTTRQWLLLAVLTKTLPGSSPSLSEAAEKYGSSRQNIKQIALGLEARGFVRLVPDPADARTTRIELTERVREFDEPRMRDRTAAMLVDVFSGLTPAETGHLLDLAQRWLTALMAPTSGEEQRT
jgi:DNA-binding MarR family transcriptional regulator